jgi:predicted membrane protein
MKEAPEQPLGEERTVVFLESATIAGAPVAYVIMLSAVVAVLSFIPFSIALSTGSSFPMSQGVYGLMGWVLGPWAGAWASGIGALVGIFLAPHTAGIPWISVVGAASGAVYAGAIVRRGRRALGAVLSVIALLEIVLFWQHAIVRNGVSPRIVFYADLSRLFAFTLFVLPTRRWIGGMIASPHLRTVAVGLFFGTWAATGLMMSGESLMAYYLLNWPQEVFVMFIPIIPLEQCFRSAIGAVIGTGVIAGLRAMSIVKPAKASY